MTDNYSDLPTLWHNMTTYSKDDVINRMVITLHHIQEEGQCNYETPINSMTGKYSDLPTLRRNMATYISSEIFLRVIQKNHHNTEPYTRKVCAMF